MDQRCAVLLLLGGDVASVNTELAAGADALDGSLLGEVLEALNGKRDGDLESVGDDGGGDDLVLGDIGVELVNGGLVPHLSLIHI